MFSSLTDNTENKKYILLLYILGSAGVLLTLLIGFGESFAFLKYICADSSCENVQSTPFARLLNIPVVWLGLVSYIVFVLSVAFNRSLSLVIISLMLGAEFYFLWIMGSVIGIWCKLCVIQFILVLIIFGLTVKLSYDRKLYLLPGKIMSAPVIALICFLVLSLPVKLKEHSGELVSNEQFYSYVGDPASSYIVEVFSDYQCPHCKRYEPVIDKLAKKRPDLMIVFRDRILDLDGLSSTAAAYLNAILFKSGRDEYLKERAKLFDNQSNLKDFLKSRLAELELDDSIKEKVAAKIDRDLKRADILKIYSTPTTVITRYGSVIATLKGESTIEEIEGSIKSN